MPISIYMATAVSQSKDGHSTTTAAETVTQMREPAALVTKKLRLH
jgi:hypothetical protein